MIVMKFGGTSVQDATAIKRVCEIVAGRLDRSPVVIVSAMARVTDALLQLAGEAGARRFDEAAAIIRSLSERHLQTARELIEQTGDAAARKVILEEVEGAIDARFAELENLARAIATLGELTPRSQDAVASFGEQLSSHLVATAMKARGLSSELVDSREFMITDDHFTAAAPDMSETRLRASARLLPLIESGRLVVAQGFIGATPDGVTTTIGRGGSDYSAAVVGAALGAERIEIWTDVDGLMTADPRIVSDARRIRIISFAEAAELSYFGAKVLHPSTVLPAVERDIPVHIFNTHNPRCEGTLIMATPKHSRNPIKSIAFKRNVTVINIASTRMLLAYGFLRRIFEVFDQHQTSVDVVTTSEVSVSVTLDSAEQLEKIKSDLEDVGQVTVESGKAIVCVVGDNLKFTPGVAAQLFSAINETNVNMISQGASEINLTFVIDNSEVDRVVRRLHDVFFARVDEEVFA
jgi:aspartate kinase